MDPSLPDRFYILNPHLQNESHDALDRVVLYMMNVPGTIDFDYLDNNLLHQLFQPSEKIQQDQFAPVTRLLERLYYLRADLQKKFDLTSFEGRRNFLIWAQRSGLPEIFMRHNIPVIRHPDRSKNGVNLIGFSNRTFGLGEYLRLVKYALDSAGVQVDVYNIASGQSPELKHGISLFCLPPTEQYKLPFRFGWDIFYRTYNIGYWPWELDQWTPNLQFCFECVNEIWAMSEYNRRMYQASTHKPLTNFKIPLHLPSPSDEPREAYGLKDDKFYFLSIFDFNSSIHRKNPTAALNAFQKAFPTDDSVRLIFKTINLNLDNQDVRAFYEKASADSRVIFITDDLPKPSLLRLIQFADVFVSLHRSEGFGIPIAEAMAMGCPAIVSNHSGNMDFCTAENSFLVSTSPVSVGQSQYHFSYDHSTWGEPNVEEAAAAMVKARLEPVLLKEKAQRAKEDVRQLLEPKIIGEKMKERIAEIYRTVPLE